MELFNLGCRVIIVYHEHGEDAASIVSSIKGGGGDSVSYKADVADFEAVKKAFDDIRNIYGRIEILVNCAGITRDHTLMKMTPEEWQSVIDVNLTGTFNCSKATIEMMRQHNYGRIVNVSSVVALAGNFGQTNYCASKSGIIGFTKALALETAKFDITVNAVAPGFTDTNMVRTIPEPVMADILRKVPKGRLCKPDEIAKAVAFLCSPNSGFITGHVLNVNGGYYM